MEQEKNNKTNRIAIAIIIGFCLIVLLIPLMEAISDGSIGGSKSKSNKYQQQQVEQLQKDLYRKGSNGKYYHK